MYFVRSWSNVEIRSCQPDMISIWVRNYSTLHCVCTQDIDGPIRSNLTSLLPVFSFFHLWCFERINDWKSFAKYRRTKWHLKLRVSQCGGDRMAWMYEGFWSPHMSWRLIYIKYLQLHMMTSNHTIWLRDTNKRLLISEDSNCLWKCIV